MENQKFRVSVIHDGEVLKFEATRDRNVDMDNIDGIIYTIVDIPEEDVEGIRQFQIQRIKKEWVQVQHSHEPDWLDESLVEAIGEELEFEDSDVLGIDSDDLDTGLDEENEDGFDWTLGDR